MFGKKPDLKKELNNLFAKEYSKNGRYHFKTFTTKGL